MKSTKFGRDTSACRCISTRSHVTQVASDFPNKLPPRESRVPETFIDTLLCIHGHTPGIMGLPGPPTPFPPLCSAGCTSTDPTLCSLRHYFPESVYYHRPVSSFMQNNLISRASKSSITPPFTTCFALCFLSRADKFSLLRSLPFLKSMRENCNNLRHLIIRIVSSATYTFTSLLINRFTVSFRSYYCY